MRMEIVNPPMIPLIYPGKRRNETNVVAWDRSIEEDMEDQMKLRNG
jgi:hypothetical protein